jgi:hypothetical protein
MVLRKTKFKVSIKELTFEFEGSHEEAQEVQDGLRQTLDGLMNTQARVLGHREEPLRVVEVPRPAAVAAAPAAAEARPEAGDGNGERTKPRPRRAKSESPTALMREMKTEGFFSQARSVSEIQERLKLKGHTVRVSTVSARLQELTKKKELFRDNGGEEGNFVYKDTPFNGTPPAPSPADQPAK